MRADLNIGFLGAGKMASALAKAFVQAGLVGAEQILASDPAPSARTHFGQSVGAQTTAFNPDVANFAPVLVLAVKPDQVDELLAELQPHLTDRHLVVSIAAGVTLTSMEG